jgi:hypothetical protein
MSAQAQTVETTPTQTAPAAAAIVADIPAVVPATVEQTPAETQAVQPEIKVAESVSKHFAELERRRNAFEQERKQHADKLASEAEDRRAFDEWRSQRDVAKKDPIKGFAMLGMTADDVAKALYEAPQATTPVDALQAKVDALQAKIDADEKAKTESQKAAVDAENMKFVRGKISEIVAAPEFELTRRKGEKGAALIMDVMTAYFVKTKGQVLPLERAAAEVEKYFEAEADESLETEKYKQKLAKASAPKTEDAPKPAEPKLQPAEPKDPKVVLSNKTNADTPSGAQPSNDASNKARAIRVLNERIAARKAAAASKKGA